MVDREKVVKKLEELLDQSRFNDSVGWNPDCDTETLEAALALLKAQEPRVMTLEEVKSLKQDAVVWYEHTGINRPRPRIVHYADDRCIVFTDGGKWHYDADGYGSLWRCWTSRPDEKTREATAWIKN